METATATSCPSCSSKLSDGIFSSNQLIEPALLALIKEYNPDANEVYCSKCFEEPNKRTKQLYVSEMNSIQNKMKDLIDDILIVSIPSPLNWEYDVLGMVTGQSTTGTGIFSEFSSSITDFFGMQSGTYNRKIGHGEELCKVQLKLKCLELGGNAIVATDIDYAEVGGAQGMLMVCMTGTAIRVKSTDVLGSTRGARLMELETLSNRKAYLTSILPKHPLYFNSYK